MTSGGFESGDDFIAARLNIDIPDGAAPGLREITQEAERLRTTLEAVTRTDMTRYLEGMENAARRAAEAQANLTEQLQSYLSVASRGESPSMGVPPGPAIDPFRGGAQSPSARPPDPADVASQIEQMRTTNPREYLNMQQARGGMTAQDTTTISPQSIQELANKISDREQAQREQVLHTDPTAQPTQQEAETGGASADYEGMAGKIARGASLAGRVANEIGPGGSLIGMGRMAAQGINWARKKYSAAADRNQGSPPAEDEVASGAKTDGAAEGATSAVAEKAGGFGLGAIASKLGIVGAAITGAIGLFEGVQKGGQAIQGLRNEASVRGGAAGEGAQVEMRARLLGMNPFISQDQARQIYQSVMGEGYADASGAGADNVIDFMSKNMQSMNISVADSAKMLRSTIMGEREGDPNSVNNALTQLRNELDTIRTASRSSVMSTPAFTQGAMDLKQQLMNAGVGAGTAGQAAISEMSEGSDDRMTAGQMAKAEGGMASSATGNALLRQFGGFAQMGMNIPSDVLPQDTAAYVGRQKGGAEMLNKASDNAMKYVAGISGRMYRGTEGSYLTAVQMFQYQLQGLPGTGALEAASSLDAAKALFTKLTGIEEPEEEGGTDPSATAGGGGGGGASGMSFMATPGGGGGRKAQSTPGGGGSGGGGGHISVGQGSVSISLTPEASRLLSVKGPNPAPLTPAQIGAAQGQADTYVNGSS